MLKISYRKRASLEERRGRIQGSFNSVENWKLDTSIDFFENQFTFGAIISRFRSPVAPHITKIKKAGG